MSDGWAYIDPAEEPGFYGLDLDSPEYSDALQRHVGAPEGSREIQCSLMSPHSPHGETFPQEPDRNWWCPGSVVDW